jgi:hypothetical protein
MSSQQEHASPSSEPDRKADVIVRQWRMVRINTTHCSVKHSRFSESSWFDDTNLDDHRSTYGTNSTVADINANALYMLLTV